jgi:hypothetical protein
VYANGKVAYQDQSSQIFFAAPSLSQLGVGSMSAAIGGTVVPPGWPVGLYGQYATDPTGQSSGFLTLAGVVGQGMSVSAGAVSTPVPGFGILATEVSGPNTVTFKLNAMPNFDSTASPQLSLGYT